MTPEQKIKHLILLKASEWDGEELGEVNANNVDELYDRLVESDGHWDAKSEVRSGHVETDIECERSRHYESKSVASKMPDGSWVGWTYWYGGGKHDRTVEASPNEWDGYETRSLYARPAPADQPVNARLLAALRFYADGHHFIQHDSDAWETVSGEPQNFLEDQANTATVEDGSVAKAAISAACEVPISFDLKTALDGVQNFFDGEYFHIGKIMDFCQVRGQRQDEDCPPEFDHCFVDQGDGGITGDDFHGTAFFHLGAGQYLTAEY